MNSYVQHCPANAAEPAVASFCDGEIGGLRRILSQLGLRANPAQERTLLELIHRSRHLRKTSAANSTKESITA